MKKGPKLSYVSVVLMLVIGAFSTIAGIVYFQDARFAAKLEIKGLTSDQAGLLIPAGLCVLLGSLGMMRRKLTGFYFAAFGMIILGLVRFVALGPDAPLKKHLWTIGYFFLAGETLFAVWQYRRTVLESKQSRANGGWGGEDPGRQRSDSPSRRPSGQTAYSFEGGTVVPPGVVLEPRHTLPAGPRTEAATPAPRQARPAPPAGKTLAHLDVGDFAPISEEEMRRRAKKVDRSLVFRFGLRSQIPPASDERTLLIDKALVAHGLLSPERLVEIHETGETWLKLRPTFESQQAAEHSAAARALADDKAQRAASKEEKRAAAAARRERHATDVAARRSTDILFLGRGVSGGLGDRRANVEKLNALGLPVLTSPAEVGQALRQPIPRLRWLAFHSEASAVSHYVRFTIPKKSGGVRELAAPHHDTAAAQRWILINILERLPMRDCAHGFIKGRNIMSNAVPHVRRDAVVNADLKDFFPTITFPRVKGIFEGLGYSPSAATVLALLCTESPRRMVEYNGKRLHVATGPRALPQGACTSPALSNLAARKLDARLDGLARKTGWTYTRYADDLTFSASGDTAAQCGGLLQALRRFCQEENFTVNEKKTRVQRQNAQQTVTGIVVNRRPNVPRDVYRRVRAILHNARRTGLAAQNRDEHPNFPMYVRGMIAWVHMANPERGKKLRAAWDKLAA